MVGMAQEPHQPHPASPLAPDALPYCIECGSRLRPEDRFCAACGTARWVPEVPPAAPTDGEVGDQPVSPDVPPGMQGSQPGSAPPAPPPRPTSSPQTPPLTAEEIEATVRLIPWIYAVGAVLSALWATYSLAQVVASKGREQMLQAIASEHLSANEQTLVLGMQIAFSVGLPVLLLVGHGLAYYGLRARARWGWLAAVIMAGLWSIVIAGIPVLVRLLRRDVREVYGVV